MSTIFDNVVTKENDHTQLLRNIMERHPKAAKAVLSYLMEREVSEVEAASNSAHNARFRVSTVERFLTSLSKETAFDA